MQQLEKHCIKCSQYWFHTFVMKTSELLSPIQHQSTYHLQVPRPLYPLVNLFQEKRILWSNSLAILMDSFSVMRGIKNGLEKTIQDTVCSSLLNIDGDTCHHTHNSCRKFVSVFNHYLEQLFCNLNTDYKWSENFRE